MDDYPSPKDLSDDFHVSANYQVLPDSESLFDDVPMEMIKQRLIHDFQLVLHTAIRESGHKDGCISSKGNSDPKRTA